MEEGKGRNGKDGVLSRHMEISNKSSDRPERGNHLCIRDDLDNAEKLIEKLLGDFAQDLPFVLCI